MQQATETESILASTARAAIQIEEAVQEENKISQFIQIAKTTLKTVGKTVRGIIETAKKLKNLPKDSPIKVIPMPAEVIPDVCANITTAITTPPWLSPLELERVDAEDAALNREQALLGKGPAGVDLSWDEYPFASGKSKAMTRPARAVPVPFWQNCVQDGIIGACYKVEDIKVGTPYTVVVIPR